MVEHNACVTSGNGETLNGGLSRYARIGIGGSLSSRVVGSSTGYPVGNVQRCKSSSVDEAIDDEMDSIIGNNTWVLADLPSGCKPLGCKWIFKRKLKVDVTIEKFKARLVIQGFRQKSGIYYFGTYALVAHINTIRLLIALASIYSLIIHQMDVKTSFLNVELDAEAPKQWYQKFDKVVLSNGYLLNQADKYVYSKFDESNKGVVICLYVDDMLIFGTDQVQVNLTKEFLSSRLSMKDVWEADVILVSTHMDTSEKLMPNNGQVVSQLEYSRVIGCLMYAMICTRPDISFAVGKLMLEGYIDVSWINNTEDNSSTSSWVFLLVDGKEAEWLRNLILEILLWSKPITPISIRCDSAATLAKAYSQMYNGKSRHLCVRHNMIRELIINGVVSIEFMRSQRNLADHLTKELDTQLPPEKTWELSSMWKAEHSVNRSTCFTIIQRMCLEPAEKEDGVFTSQWLISLKKCLARA
ncbi:zinc finger, CCHC-type containing protein [Tanacetum coccineum]